MSNSFSMNDAIEPLPADYLQLIRQRIPYAVATADPRPMNAWSIYEPKGWHVCVLTGAGDQLAAILGRNRIDTVISHPSDYYCGNATFRPLAAAEGREGAN